VSESTENLVVVRIAFAPDANLPLVSNHLAISIKGQQVSLSDGVLNNICDTTRVRKVYKLNAFPSGSKKTSTGDPAPKDELLQTLEVQILGLMALRGAS
jgi:Kinase binding protein CGI-121